MLLLFLLSIIVSIMWSIFNLYILELNWTALRFILLWLLVFVQLSHLFGYFLMSLGFHFWINYVDIGLIIDRWSGFILRTINAMDLFRMFWCAKSYFLSLVRWWRGSLTFALSSTTHNKLNSLFIFFTDLTSRYSLNIFFI